MGGPDEHHSVDTSDGANDAVCVIVVTAVVPALMFSPPAAGDAAAPAGTSSPAPAGAADNAPLHALTDGQDGPNGCVPVRDRRRFPDSVLAVEQLLGRSDLHRGGLRS